MFRALKDSVAASTARRLLNQHLARYGSVEALHLDSRNRRLEVTGTPHGEAEPVTLVIDRYELDRTADTVHLRVLDCTCSRPWLQALIEDHLYHRPLEIPRWAAAFL
ncbi:hypothetical protein [Actomonas aquatica]|uniref:Uncharacterized protein n=1 Tax=Actomonas aquatica TaxID=2866162 RepID=A0ABZ1C5J1_9BACT|nr:hypothetical protein [Opitutus sp. WL0086]WRQ86498.1 hypothetical protein K1X11_016905 [Opitutus sp. WL0086]